MPLAIAPDAHLDAGEHIAIGVARPRPCRGRQQPLVAALADHDALGEAIDAGERDVQIGEDAHRREAR